MSMSISRHSAQINVRTACMLLLATAFTIVPAYASPPRKATSAEVQEVTKQLSTILTGHDEFADGLTASKAQNVLYWSAPEGGTLLAPILVRFPGEPSGYCRLATLSTNLKVSTLVKTPEEVNSPDCKGFRDLHYMDVNGDGQLDVIASMNIKSNSFDGYVDVPIVYLSLAGQPGGYCYSADASSALQPVSMTSDDKIKKALDREKQRRGVKEFKCADGM